MNSENLRKHAEAVQKLANDYDTTVADLRNMDVITAFREQATKKLNSLVSRAKNNGIPFKLNVEQAVNDLVEAKFPTPKGEMGMMFDPPLSKFGLNEKAVASYLDGEKIRLGYHDLGEHGHHELVYVYRDGTWYGKYTGSHGTEYWLSEPPYRSSY